MQASPMSGKEAAKSINNGTVNKKWKKAEIYLSQYIARFITVLGVDCQSCCIFTNSVLSLLLSNPFKAPSFFMIIWPCNTCGRKTKSNKTLPISRWCTYFYIIFNFRLCPTCSQRCCTSILECEGDHLATLTSWKYL